jgi:hypothetical protein
VAKGNGERLRVVVEKKFGGETADCDISATNVKRSSPCTL